MQVSGGSTNPSVVETHVSILFFVGDRSCAKRFSLVSSTSARGQRARKTASEK